jgi:patatin-like phospholipase/acyl hydrolase
MKRVNMMTLNGGGTRTKLEIKMLKYLELVLGDKFKTFFEITAGASGGALISGLLAVGKTPSQIEDIYDKALPKIFDASFFREVIGKSKYSNEYLKGFAFELCGNIRLGDLKQKIVIPTVNTSDQKTKIFKSYVEKDMNYRLVDVIVASSSAPRYFPSYPIQIEDILNWFKDGGLSSNNPSDILAIEGMNPEYGYDEVNILSITSGENKDVVTKAEIKGNLLSIPEMIDEILNLQDKKSHGNVQMFYKYKLLTGTYERCEAQIKHSNGLIDDASKRNIINMTRDAFYSLEYNKAKIDDFIKKVKN